MKKYCMGCNKEISDNKKCVSCYPKELKEFTVAFGDWIIEALDEKQAEEKALERLKEGDVPPINLIEEN